MTAKLLGGVLVLSILTGCSTAPDGTAIPPEGPTYTTQQKIEDFSEVLVAVSESGLDPSPTVPVSGDASYAGFAVLEALLPDDSAVFYAGQSEIEAEFSAAGVDLDGTLDRFVVRHFADEAEYTAELEPFRAATNDAERVAGLESFLDGAESASGSILMRARGASGPGGMPVMFDGELTSGGTRITVGGSGEAQFRGPNQERLRADSSTSDGLTVLYDGTPVSNGGLSTFAAKE